MMVAKGLARPFTCSTACAGLDVLFSCVPSIGSLLDHLVCAMMTKRQLGEVPC